MVKPFKNHLKPFKNHLKIEFGPFKNGLKRVLNGRKHFKIFLNGKTI